MPHALHDGLHQQVRELSPPDSSGIRQILADSGGTCGAVYSPPQKNDEVFQHKPRRTIPKGHKTVFHPIRSDVQGLGKPPGFKGKGQEGKGQGKDFMTLRKPLPL